MTGRQILLATLAGVVACTAACAPFIVPAEEARGAFALVRADTAEDAATLARDVDDLVPCVTQGRPGHAWHDAEVWLKPPADPESEEVNADLAGAYLPEHGLIWVRDDEPGVRRIVIAHELAHSAHDPAWNVLPDAVIEGLCDVVAFECVPESRTFGEAFRLHGAMIARHILSLEIEYRGEQAHRSRESVGLQATPAIPVDAILETVISTDPADDAPPSRTVYGVGYVLADELIRRHGWEGLLQLCRAHLEEGGEGFSPGEILAAAGIDGEHDLADLIVSRLDGETFSELLQLDLAMTSHMLVVAGRYNYKAESLDDYLLSDPYLRPGHGDSDAVVALSDLTELVEAMRKRWHGDGE